MEFEVRFLNLLRVVFHRSAPTMPRRHRSSKPPGYPTHNKSKSPYQSYSKGSRGLSVLFAGKQHLHCYYNFTESLVETVRPDRYTIRAGRNLPDKEFRYLRTVIVTAAIHRGLNSMLYSLRADKSPFDLSALGRYHTLYILLDELAECCVFS